MKSLRSWGRSALMAALVVAAAAPQITPAVQAQDLKEGIPADVFLAVHGMANPERDYQKAYYAEVWNEVERSDIINRLLKIVQSNMSEGDLEEMMAFQETLMTAVEPIEWDKLQNIQEVAYGQKLEGPVNHQIVFLRVPDDGASSLVAGVTNLFKLAEGAAQGAITVETETHEGVAITAMRLPPQVPMSPCVGVEGDLFVFSTSPEMAKRCVSLLKNPSAESKFDDPRVAKALSNLPQAEDALVFFDGVALQQQLNGIVAFIRGVGASDEGALRAATLIEAIFAEVQYCEYEVTVEYTDGYRNLTASYGKRDANAANTVVGKMLGEQETFADWKKWVPESASGFSLNGGASLHPLYEWVTTKVPEMFPESQQGFEQFAAIQDQYDIHLDADFLQGFSGESVSIAMPGPQTPFSPSSKSVAFMKCDKPERITELIDRGLDLLLQIPEVQQQGIQVVDADMEGFKQVKANVFMMMGGLTPVFGMSDGWMAIGSHADAVQTVMMTKGGEAPTFADSEQFKKFGLDVDGAVHSISYANTGENIRQMAAGLQQMGAMAPMIMMSVPQNGNGPDMKPVQDILGLMPSVGRIIGKMDFIEGQLSVCQPGDSDDTYVRHAVTTIRPPSGSR